MSRESVQWGLGHEYKRGPMQAIRGRRVRMLNSSCHFDVGSSNLVELFLYDKTFSRASREVPPTIKLELFRRVKSSVLNGDYMASDTIRPWVCRPDCDTSLVCQRMGSGKLVSWPRPSMSVHLGPRHLVWEGDHYYPYHSLSTPQKEAPLRLSRRREGGSFRHGIGMTEGFICV
ncbi:hypothetical protein BHE74_00054586 [Ensete ventricosum]|nr:hypothetical protein BHE74_00054586 [Ensete ventricosum]